VTSPSAPSAPGHIGLAVRDLRRSVPFYRDAFALTLTLWEQDGAGLQHLAFEVPSPEDLQAAQHRLARLGASLVYDGVVPHAEGAASGGLFFTDPDGLRLELYAQSGIQADAPVSGAPTCGFF
jgi:catechol 2,3-dioxygenase-like lactoylglutathione lyase family enzyme